jgi:hypothetical protein
VVKQGGGGERGAGGDWILDEVANGQLAASQGTQLLPNREWPSEASH